MPFRSLRPVSVVALAALFFAPIAGVQAQTLFTLTATADSSTLGFLQNTAYTFVFVANDGFVTGSQNTFGFATNDWVDEGTGDDALWNTVSGSSLGGTYARAVSTGSDPRSYLRTDQINALTLIAGAEDSSIGLLTPSFNPITAIHVELVPTLIGSFAYPATFTSIDHYFLNFYGTYTAFDGAYIAVESGLSFVQFTPTTLVIGPLSAVPEPSTGTVLAGFAALAFAVHFRRPGRRRRA